MHIPLRPHLPDDITLKIVDVGASPVDGPPPYQPLIGQEGVEIVGFEPDGIQFARLKARPTPKATWLKEAVGDGSDGVLHVCRNPALTSLYEPDFDVLDHFHGYARWAEVVDKTAVKTRRLDDIPETQGMDFLKIDVQGGELGVLQGGMARLKDAVAVHLDVHFVPFYKGQPLFSDLDVLLRDAGFYLHTFMPIQKRVLGPMIINDDPYAGLNQALRSDALYVRRFTELGQLTPSSLMKLAWLAHDLYGSVDLAALAFHSIDKRTGSSYHDGYLSLLAQRLAA